MSSVAIRAFRGTRRSSVYREHVLDEAAFERIAAATTIAELARWCTRGGDGWLLIETDA